MTKLLMKEDCMMRIQIVIMGCIAVLISTLPTTAIAQTTTVRPAIVRDVDNGDRADGGSGHVAVNLSDSDASGHACMLSPVPAGKRRIVRHVFATVTVPTGQSPVVMAAYGDSAGNIIAGNERPFVMVSQGASSPTQTRFVGSTPMYLRYDAGNTICFIVTRYPATGNLSATLGFTGYTIDYP
jgi:hypothetical protein